MSESTSETNLPRTFWIGGAIIGATMLGLVLLLVCLLAGVGIGIKLGTQQEAARLAAAAVVDGKKKATAQNEGEPADEKSKKQNDAKVAAPAEEKATVVNLKESAQKSSVKVDDLVGKWEQTGGNLALILNPVIFWEFNADGTGRTNADMKWKLAGDICSIETEGSGRDFRVKLDGNELSLEHNDDKAKEQLFPFTRIVLKRVVKKSLSNDEIAFVGRWELVPAVSKAAVVFRDDGTGTFESRLPDSLMSMTKEQLAKTYGIKDGIWKIQFKWGIETDQNNRLAIVTKTREMGSLGFNSPHPFANLSGRANSHFKHEGDKLTISRFDAFDILGGGLSPVVLNKVKDK